MATVTAMTAARMLAIEAESITGARVDAATFHLILTRHDGTEIDAGDIQGPVGPMNPNAADLSDVNPQTFAGNLIIAGNTLGLAADLSVRLVNDGGSIYSVYTDHFYFDHSGSVVGNVDSFGNATFSGAITSSTGIFSSPAPVGQVIFRPAGSASNDGAMVGTSAGIWHLYDAAGNVRQTLDDGAGNMSIAGDLRLIGASSNIKTSSNSVTFQDANGHGFLGAYDDGAGGGTNLYTIRGGAVGNMLDDGSGHIRATAQIYPGSEGLAGQTSGGFLHAAGVPANANGNNNDWCISDNGHLYFKAAGAWVQKI